MAIDFTRRDPEELTGGVWPHPDDEEREPPTCTGCGEEIDPDCCQCGTVRAHHGNYHLHGGKHDHGHGDTHAFTPLGCRCHRDSDALWEGF